MFVNTERVVQNLTYQRASVVQYNSMKKVSKAYYNEYCGVIKVQTICQILQQLQTSGDVQRMTCISQSIMEINREEGRNHLCWIFIALLSDCSSSLELRSLSPAAPQLLGSKHITQMEWVMFLRLLLPRDMGERWRGAQLCVPWKRPEQPSITTTCFPTTMLNNTTLPTQVKVNENDLLSGMPMAF